MTSATAGAKARNEPQTIPQTNHGYSDADRGLAQRLRGGRDRFQSGSVWRDARQVDLVCVTPHIGSQTEVLHFYELLKAQSSNPVVAICCALARAMRGDVHEALMEILTLGGPDSAPRSVLKPRYMRQLPSRALG